MTRFSLKKEVELITLYYKHKLIINLYPSTVSLIYFCSKYKTYLFFWKKLSIVRRFFDTLFDFESADDR